MKPEYHEAFTARPHPIVPNKGDITAVIVSVSKTVYNLLIEDFVKMALHLQFLSYKKTMGIPFK